MAPEVQSSLPALIPFPPNMHTQHIHIPRGKGICLQLSLLSHGAISFFSRKLGGTLKIPGDKSLHTALEG